MSISNILVPNEYDLFGRSITVRDLIADHILSKSTLSDWDATLSYDIGNFVIYDLSIWRSIANANLNHIPSEASVYWVRAINLYQNNVDEKQVIVNQTIGSDDVNKSNVVPFLTIQTALTFAGDDSYIYVSTNDGSYAIGTLTISGINQNLATLANIGKFVNTLVGKLVISADAQNFVLSGFKIDSTSDVDPSVTIRSLSNTYFQDCYFDDQNNISEILFDDDPDTLSWGGGSTIFYNCQSNATEINTNQITIQGNPVAGTKIYIYAWRGVVRLNVIPSNSNVEVYVVNCTQLSIAAHSNGLIYCDGNLVFPNDIVSTATNADPKNKLVILNSSMYDPLTSTYSHINKTGNCPWYFHDLDADIVGNTLTGAGKYGNYFMDDLSITGDIDIGGDVAVTGNATVAGTLGVTLATNLGVLSADTTSVSSLASAGGVSGVNAAFTGTLQVVGISTLGTTNAGATSATTLSTSGLAILDSLNVSGITGLTGAVTTGAGVSVGAGLSTVGNITCGGNVFAATGTGNVNAGATSGNLTGFNVVLTNDRSFTLATMQVSGDPNVAGVAPANIYATNVSLSYQKRGARAFVSFGSGIPNFTTNLPAPPTNSWVLYLNNTDNSILFQANTANKLQPPTYQFTNLSLQANVNGVLKPVSLVYVNTYNLALWISSAGNWDVAGNNNSLAAGETSYTCAV